MEAARRRHLTRHAVEGAEPSENRLARLCALERMRDQRAAHRETSHGDPCAAALGQHTHGPERADPTPARVGCCAESYENTMLGTGTVEGLVATAIWECGKAGMQQAKKAWASRRRRTSDPTDHQTAAGEDEAISVVRFDSGEVYEIDQDVREMMERFPSFPTPLDCVDWLVGRYTRLYKGDPDPHLFAVNVLSCALDEIKDTAPDPDALPRLYDEVTAARDALAEIGHLTCMESTDGGETYTPRKPGKSDGASTRSTRETRRYTAAEMRVAAACNTAEIEAAGYDIEVEVRAQDVLNVHMYGDADGSVTVFGTGEGDAKRSGLGAGDASRRGIADGSANRHGAGEGDALRTGRGDGWAWRDGPGAGHARREGDGAGIAHRDGPGIGNAYRDGPGQGHAFRKGTGAGAAYEDGTLVDHTSKPSGSGPK